MQTVEEVITPEVEEVLTPEVVSFVKTETMQISRELQALEVSCPEEDKKAVELGLANKNAIRKIEAFRKALVTPLNDAVDNLNAVFKKISAPFIANDLTIKAKRDVYIDAQEKAAKAEQARLDAQRAKEQALLDAQAAKDQAKLDKKAAKTGAEAPVIAPTILPPAQKVQVEKTVQTDLGHSTIRKIPKFEIMDEFMIPREYMMPDEKKIGALVRARAIKSIPGVRIYEVNSQSF